MCEDADSCMCATDARDASGRKWNPHVDCGVPVSDEMRVASRPALRTLCDDKLVHDCISSTGTFSALINVARLTTEENARSPALKVHVALLGGADERTNMRSAMEHQCQWLVNASMYSIGLRASRLG